MSPPCRAGWRTRATSSKARSISALRDGDKLSHEQIRLCYDFAAGDLKIDLSRALPDAK